MALDPETLADMPRFGDGIGAALGVIEAEGRLDDEATQEDLFASSPLLGSEFAKALTPARGRGRPPGALNTTTDAWRNFFLKHYRSPLLGLGDLAAADPFALHTAILAHDRAHGVEKEISLLDVLALQKSANEALGAYVHRKQPIAIDAGEDTKVPLFQQVIVDGGTLARLLPQVAAVAGESDAFVPVLDDEVAGEKSHDGSEGGASD